MLAPILGGATESSLHAALWWLSFWDAQKCSCNCNRPKNSVSTTSSVSGWARNGRPRLDSEPQAGTCGLVIGFWWTFVGSECCDESTTLDPREQVSWRQARCLHCQWIIFEPIWYSWIFNRTVSRALSVSFCFQVSRTVSHSSQVVYSESWWSHGEAPKVSKGLKRVWIKFWRSWNTFAKHQAKHLFAAEVLINFWNRIWKSSQKISSNTPSRGCDWPLKQPAPKILKPTKDNTALWDLLTKSALILDGVDDARALMEYQHRRATAVTVVRCMSSAAFKGPPGPPSPALRSRSPIPCGPSRFVNQRNQRNPYDHGRAVRQLHRCAQQESAMADGPGHGSTGRGPATESRNGEVPDFFRLVLRCFKPWPWHSGWCLFLWTFSAILKACQEQYLFLKTGVSKN